MTVGLAHYLAVAAILFTIGVFGIFVNRKNVIVILMSVELILLAVNINLVAFSSFLGDLVGQVFAPGATAAPSVPIPDISNTEALGQILYTRYVYFFQAAGLVLLVAMVGAIVLTLRHRVPVKRQDMAAQVRRTKAEAIEVVKVRTGQGLT